MRQNFDARKRIYIKKPLSVRDFRSFSGVLKQRIILHMEVYIMYIIRRWKCRKKKREHTQHIVMRQNIDGSVKIKSIDRILRGADNGRNEENKHSLSYLQERKMPLVVCVGQGALS